MVNDIEQMQSAETVENDGELVFGKNAVTELLRSGAAVDTLYLTCDETDKVGAYLASLAKENGAVVKHIHPQKLTKICGSDRHQGVAVRCIMCDYCTIEDIVAVAKERKEKPFIIVTDGIEDPHNLGAIIRTAECAGAHGVILQKRRGCSVTATVHRASAGACSHIKISRVTNLAAAINQLKELGIFFYCADMDGEYCCDVDMTGATALVVGSEGFGVSRLTKELCDKVVSLPIMGEVGSLNASVAAGALIYEIVRQNKLCERRLSDGRK
ncbi:MAG: 23S rRNA (guanosine(2251)-2'-O)-methyltransferase RlmB [Oscillospiraceae bacterium]